MENAFIFDTHAHYTDDAFKNEPASFFNNLYNSGVHKIITCGCDADDSLNALNLAQKFPFMYAAVGYHPENITETAVFDYALMESLILNPKTVAVGEIGLDYYWDAVSRKKQVEFFRIQLEFANKHDMPVIIHNREAHADTLEILKEYRPKGVVHCFSGSAEMAAELIKKEIYIGFGGVITFKNAKKSAEVLKSIPLEKVLLETDCPYLAPEPLRGSRNTSANIIYVAQKIAEIKGITLNEVLDATFKNAVDLFKIK